VAWANPYECDIESGKYSGDQIPDKTFGQLLERYLKDVSPGRRDSGRRERVMIPRMLNGPAPLVSMKPADLSETDIAHWRDRRLQEVSASSVLREWNTLSCACSIALDEWRWLHHHPMKKVRRPATPRPRTRTSRFITRKILLFQATEVSARFARM